MSEFQKDNSFDLNNISAYKLSIQVNLDGFSFFILNNEETRLLAWQYTTVTISSENFIARRLKEWIESEKILCENFNSVNVTYFSGEFTCIPEALFEENKNHSEFRLLFPDLVNQKIVSFRDEKSKTFLLCAIPANLEQLLIQQFNNYTLTHPVQHLIKGLHEIESTSGNRVAIWLDIKKFFITIVRNNQINLVNRFNYLNSNDILYYTILTLKQLEISPQKSFLYLSGHLDKKGDLVVKLNKYFGLVEFLKPNKGLKFDPGKMNIPRHKLISLF